MVRCVKTGQASRSLHQPGGQRLVMIVLGSGAAGGLPGAVGGPVPGAIYLEAVAQGGSDVGGVHVVPCSRA
jgi:hypothetical protein